jgi:hypothetical protein
MDWGSGLVVWTGLGLIFVLDWIRVVFKVVILNKDQYCNSLKLQGLKLPYLQNFVQGLNLKLSESLRMILTLWAPFDYFASPAPAFNLFPMSCSFLSVLALFSFIFHISVPAHTQIQKHTFSRHFCVVFGVFGLILGLKRCVNKHTSMNVLIPFIILGGGGG